ncbi:hypothetical protein [Intestinirhabdus alba]|uniref:Uncharacterized protein n=1 Tax=Intestinirhabdus alba TaxID=2899544 RepID=A0A6L6IKM5_9ENTR|nr:hypothetical protein [Intestinirhabdus alba]MTH45600.1 hypothetical protein [Intestinirhabdus alba]
MKSGHFNRPPGKSKRLPVRKRIFKTDRAWFKGDEVQRMPGRRTRIPLYLACQRADGEFSGTALNIRCLHMMPPFLAKAVYAGTKQSAHTQKGI